jgi:hypothetical protein
MVHNPILDRIDSSKGYLEDNVQWVHKDFQKIKLDLTEDSLLDWAKKIVITAELNHAT